MKIVIAGDGHSEIHERAYARALGELGHDVTGSYWAPHFRRTLGIGTSDWRSFGARLQARLNEGPIVRRYNAELLDLCTRVRPDLFIGYRGTIILPATLRAIRKATGAVLASVNDDDPYSPGASGLEWRHFRTGVPEYDFNFVHRHSSIDDYRAHGGRGVHLLRSDYMPWRNFPMELTEEQRKRYGNDVVYVGHWEPDGREQKLELLVAAGIDLRIYGPGWEEPFRRSALLQRLPEPVYLDADYNVVLNAARIVLNIMSTLNRDTYTDRCFEVPASGGFLLSQYSDDLTTLYQEGKEIAFFRSGDDLLEKVRYYLAHEDERRAIARAGMEAARRKGYDIVSRMREMIAAMEPALAAKR